MPDTPPTLLAEALRRDPTGPLITYYDDATDERTELSAITTANWVAKTANLLRDELDVEPGERIGVILPTHWQTAVVLLAVWSLGAAPQPRAAGAAVVVADETSLGSLPGEARAVLGLSLAPMNAPLADAPAGVVDYAAEVLGAADDFVPAESSGVTEVLAARLWAAEVGLAVGDRVLVSEAVGVGDALDWLLAPLCAGASIVLCRNTDPLRLGRRVATERVTSTLGVSVEGVRRLDG